MEKMTVTNALAKGEGYASDSLRDLLRKGIDKACVFNVAYTDYGGTIYDRAIIEATKKDYPNDIVCETTSYNGENAFIFGEAAKLLQDDKVDVLIEDVLCEIEGELTDKEIKNFLTSYDLDNLSVDSQNIIDSILREVFWEVGNFEPNGIDYAEDQVIERAEEFLALENTLTEEIGKPFSFKDFAN